jgi:hypothetical protein
MPVLLGADRAAHEHIVQGEALRIASDALRAALERVALAWNRWG